jgi:hypothetical protein
MVKLTAIRQLTGSYGSVAPGQSFNVDEKTAEHLEARGLAKRASSAKSTGPAENKATGPESNKSTPKSSK